MVAASNRAGAGVFLADSVVPHRSAGFCRIGIAVWQPSGSIQWRISEEKRRVDTHLPDCGKNSQNFSTATTAKNKRKDGGRKRRRVLEQSGIVFHRRRCKYFS